MAELTLNDYTLITEKEADDKYNFGDYIEGMYGDECKYRLYDGDLNISQSLDTYQEIQRTAEKDGEVYGFIITGNLTVDGILEQPDGDYGETLLVLGNTKVAAINKGGAQFFFKGNLKAKQAVYGYYNHGSLVVAGDAEADVFYADDHYFSFSGQVKGTVIDAGSIEGASADFTYDDLADVLLPQLIDAEGYHKSETISDFINTGKAILRSGAKPAYLLAEEKVNDLVAAGSPVLKLDLSNSKLKSLPVKLFELTSLEDLDLSNNPDLQKLPPEIKTLTNLKSFGLGKTGLQSLPEEIGELLSLEVLDISSNGSGGYGDKLPLILPESLGKLTNLKTLSMNYNRGIELPASLANLKNLLELNFYQCTYDGPADFPLVFCELTNLRKLDIGSNSFTSIPGSFTRLNQLAELNLNASLCYLKELPDLTPLAALKVLHAHGNRSDTTRPYPRQELLAAFFTIPNLEELSIDRHGESKETFKNESFERLLNNLKSDPERQQEIRNRIKPKEENQFYGTILEGIMRDRLTANHLKGIGKLQKLRILDLSFNRLDHLPAEIFELANLEAVNLEYNEGLPTEELKKLYETFPNAKINARKIRTRVEPSDPNAKKIDELSKEGIALLRSKDWPTAILKFEEAKSLCVLGKVFSDYQKLYSHYGIVYALSYWLVQQDPGPERDANVKKLIETGKVILDDLVPASESIWYYTEEGTFQREALRMAGNSVGWQLMEQAQNLKAEKETERLEQALSYAERASEHVDGAQHYFIYDTQVRILLALKRKQEAYTIVQRVLYAQPDFGDFQDFTGSEEYQNWVGTTT